jgi:two-component system response regulator AtoC
MSKATILVVDDEDLIRWSLKGSLEKEKYEVLTARNGEEAMAIINTVLPDLVLQDINLPGISGLELLEHVRKSGAESLVIMMSAYEDIDTSVRAMKLGAYDFIEKPFNFEKMKLTIAKALETVYLKKEVQEFKSREKAQYGIQNIIGKTPAMKRVFETVAKLVRSDATPVLLQGESGTGKNAIAKTIHYQSHRSDHPYRKINCSSLQDAPTELELFGHEESAFDSAQVLKKGLLEQTDGGTILLDQIGNMSMGSQAKLLQLIENKSFKRIGGAKDIVVDVRIIATTNKDLQKASAVGTFRENLFSHFKEFLIYIPPLRERKDDIGLLARHFVAMFNREFGKKVEGFSPEAEALLVDYDWPGNVRELKNAIERAMIFESRDMILAEHLPLGLTMAAPKSSPPGPPVKLPIGGVSVEEVEKELIQQALASTRGNQVHAAKLLKMSRDTLRYRMKKYDLM